MLFIYEFLFDVSEPSVPNSSSNFASNSFCISYEKSSESGRIGASGILFVLFLGFSLLSCLLSSSLNKSSNESTFKSLVALFPLQNMGCLD